MTTKLATAAVGFPVIFEWHNPETGIRWIHLGMTQPYDYAEVAKTPRVLSYNDEVYVRTGWNSDKGEMYYRNCMPLAAEVK